jgi:hypothetical protein
VSKSLAELGESAGRAVAQAKLYEVSRQPRLIAMAQALKEAAEELAAALRRGLSAERLALAKRLASSAVEAARRARGDSLAGAGVVEGLKDQEIVRRLHEAAGAVHDAADRLAEVLSVR